MLAVPYFLKRSQGKMKQLYDTHDKRIEELRKRSRLMIRKEQYVNMKNIEKLENEKARLNMELQALYDKLVRLEGKAQTTTPFQYYTWLKGRHNKVNANVRRVRTLKQGRQQKENMQARERKETMQYDKYLRNRLESLRKP